MINLAYFVTRKAQGRIGAEKIYNLIRGFDRGDKLEALRRTVAVIEKRTRYVKAMNIVLSDGKRTWTSSLFSEDPAYFTLRRKSKDGLRIVCSEPYPGDAGWENIENRFVGEI